jgi:glucosylceramidase
VNAADHPIYTPVHRYARNILVSLDHWVCGWIDWNIVLNRRGGPNHVGNHCGAPIMIDTDDGYVYYTPVYYILAQLSRTIRPGDHAVRTRISPESDTNASLCAFASINTSRLLSLQVLNPAKHDIRCSLQIGAQFAELDLVANSLQTIRVQLPSSANASDGGLM